MPLAGFELQSPETQAALRATLACFIVKVYPLISETRTRRRAASNCWTSQNSRSVMLQQRNENVSKKSKTRRKLPESSKPPRKPPPNKRKPALPKRPQMQHPITRLDLTRRRLQHHRPLRRMHLPHQHLFRY